MEEDSRESTPTLESDVPLTCSETTQTTDEFELSLSTTPGIGIDNSPTFCTEIPQSPQQENQISPELEALIFHSHDSLVYRTLSTGIIPDLTDGDKTALLTDLQRYLDVAVDANLIQDAIYVQNIIDAIKRFKAKTQSDRQLKQIEQKIKETKAELEERTTFWSLQEEALIKELDFTMKEIDAQLEQAISDLDDEWQSPKKRQQYSKPSPALLNLREMAKKQIRARQFEEATALGELISQKEQEEIREASQRMNADYRAADARIHSKYEGERVVAQRVFESKLLNIQRTRDQNLRPLQRHLENLEKSKQRDERMQKTSRQNTTRPVLPSRTSSRRSNQMPSVFGTPKLALPSITPLRRERSKTSASITRPKTGVGQNK